MMVSHKSAPLPLYIRQAAETAGVGVYELHRANGRKNAWRFRLVPINGAFQRYSASPFGKPRRVNGVCWHAHREFMRNLYALVSDARIQSQFATYRNAEHFEDTHEATAYREVGARIAPVAFVQLCDC